MSSLPIFLCLTYFQLNELWSISKHCKPDNFEAQNFLKLCFKDTCSLFFLSFFESNLIDSISLEGVILLYSESIVLLITSMTWSCNLWERRTSFAWDLSLENYADSSLCFQMVYFTQCFNYSSSIHYIFGRPTRFFILFHLTKMRFFQSNHWMCLFLETSRPS